MEAEIRITEANDVNEGINQALQRPANQIAPSYCATHDAVHKCEIVAQPESIPIPEKEKTPAGTCIGCGSTRVTMSVFMIATTRNVAPQVRQNTRAMAVCSECCNPESPHYASLGSILSVQVFSLRNMVFEKVAEAWRERKGQ